MTLAQSAIGYTDVQVDNDHVETKVRDQTELHYSSGTDEHNVGGPDEFSDTTVDGPSSIFEEEDEIDEGDRAPELLGRSLKKKRAQEFIRDVPEHCNRCGGGQDTPAAAPEELMAMMYKPYQKRNDAVAAISDIEASPAASTGSLRKTPNPGSPAQNCRPEPADYDIHGLVKEADLLRQDLATVRDKLKSTKREFERPAARLAVRAHCSQPGSYKLYYTGKESRKYQGLAEKLDPASERIPALKQDQQMKHGPVATQIKVAGHGLRDAAQQCEEMQDLRRKLEFADNQIQFLTAKLEKQLDVKKELTDLLLSYNASEGEDAETAVKDLKMRLLSVLL